MWKVRENVFLSKKKHNNDNNKCEIGLYKDKSVEASEFQ